MHLRSTWQFLAHGNDCLLLQPLHNLPIPAVRHETAGEAIAIFRVGPDSGCPKAPLAALAPTIAHDLLESGRAIPVSKIAQWDSNPPVCGERPVTRWVYPPKHSSAFRLPLTLELIIVTFIVVDFSEHLNHVQLPSSSNIFVQRGSHRFLLGPMMAYFPGFLNQTVVNGEIGRHGNNLHLSMCIIKCSSLCD